MTDPHDGLASADWDTKPIPLREQILAVAEFTNKNPRWLSEAAQRTWLALTGTEPPEEKP